MSKYCVKICAFGFFFGIAAASQVSASESVTEIANQSKTKANLVRVMQERIARHQQMSLEDIREELRIALEKNQAEFARAGKTTSSTERVFQLATAAVNDIQDKDLLIAQERASLQTLVSSKNILFALTKGLVHEMRRGDGCEVFFGTILLLFTIPIDFATLPITFLGSLVTGF